jgi:hypothetical protein
LSFNQSKNLFVSTASTAIGMFPCPEPQISLHCPKKTPFLIMKSDVWFNLPGQASNLTPNEGIAQLCRTSAAVTNTLV